ncbi:MAG: hypothetical protein KIT87_03910 [Anaerolineae bacterium]|nr:hypothetical protein [Anaerolineae bacterium]
MTNQWYSRDNNTLYSETYRPPATADRTMIHQTHGSDVPRLDALPASFPQAILSAFTATGGTIIALAALLFSPLEPWLIGLLWAGLILFSAWAWWDTYDGLVSENRELARLRFEAETARIAGVTTKLATPTQDTPAPTATLPAPAIHEPDPEERHILKLCAVFEHLLDDKGALRGGAFITVRETGDSIKQPEQRDLLEELRDKYKVAAGGKGETWRLRYPQWTRDQAIEALTLALEGKPYPLPMPIPQPQAATP